MSHQMNPMIFQLNCGNERTALTMITLPEDDGRQISVYLLVTLENPAAINAP